MNNTNFPKATISHEKELNLGILFAQRAGVKIFGYKEKGCKMMKIKSSNILEKITIGR